MWALTAARCVDVKLETGTMVGAKASAEEAVRLYHQRFNEERFSDIFDSSDAAFRTAASRADTINRMKEDRVRLGRIVETEVVGASCIPFQIRLVIHSKYERSNFTEFFLFRIRGARADLLRYERTEGLIIPSSDSLQKCP